MKTGNRMSPSPAPALKDSTGWFAAGPSFRRALTELSNGAFKLFAWICLEADRRTGRFEATQKELAAALGKSKRIVGRYVAELQTAEVCTVHPGSNQYARTAFEIRDRFWPYHRAKTEEEPAELSTYVDSVRQRYLKLGCVDGRFGAADQSRAKNLFERRIPVNVVCNALLLGACRKYMSWLNGTPSASIQSLAYFESVITEVQQQQRLPAGYTEYLRQKLESFAESWTHQQRLGPPCLPTPDQRVLEKKGNQQIRS